MNQTPFDSNKLLEVQTLKKRPRKFSMKCPGRYTGSGRATFPESAFWEVSLISTWERLRQKSTGKCAGSVRIVWAILRAKRAQSACQKKRKVSADSVRRKVPPKIVCGKCQRIVSVAKCSRKVFAGMCPLESVGRESAGLCAPKSVHRKVWGKTVCKLCANYAQTVCQTLRKLCVNCAQPVRSEIRSEVCT